METFLTVIVAAMIIGAALLFPVFLCWAASRPRPLSEAEQTMLLDHFARNPIQTGPIVAKQGAK